MHEVVCWVASVIASFYSMIGLDLSSDWLEMLGVELSLEGKIRLKMYLRYISSFAVGVSGAYYYYIVIYQSPDRYDEGFKAGCDSMKKDMEGYLKKANCDVKEG